MSLRSQSSTFDTLEPLRPTRILDSGIGFARRSAFGPAADGGYDASSFLRLTEIDRRASDKQPVRALFSPQ